MMLFRYAFYFIHCNIHPVYNFSLIDLALLMRDTRDFREQSEGKVKDIMHSLIIHVPLKSNPLKFKCASLASRYLHYDKESEWEIKSRHERDRERERETVTL